MVSSDVALVCCFFLMLLAFVDNVKLTAASNLLEEEEDREDDDNATISSTDAKTTKIHLLDIQDFQYLMTPDFGDDEESSMLHFLFLVHSDPTHFEQRRLIRETWGSVRRLEEHRTVEVVFLLGMPPASKPELKARNGRAINSKFLRKKETDENGGGNSLQSRVAQEQFEHRDILQGAFADTPRNSSLKHLMGLKWISEKRSKSKPVFVIKSDDDIFVELFHLYKFVNAIYGNSPAHSLVCEVVPSEPVSSDWQSHQTDIAPHGPLAMFPEHCSSMAFLMTPDLVERLLVASDEIAPPPSTTGDAYVTGLLRESLQQDSNNPFSLRYLNLRYTHDEQSSTRWLLGSTPMPLPYLFASSGGNGNSWAETARGLWAKTLRVHGMGRL